MNKSEMDESERRIFNPFVPGPNGERWRGLIILGGGSFDALRKAAREIVGEVAKANAFREMPIAGAGGGGASAQCFNCLFTSPIELQIAELRRRADELEKSLGGETTIARLR